MATNTHSHVYLKRLKSMVELCKSLHPFLVRIPNPLPRPNTDSFRGGKAMDAKTAQARQEAFNKRDSLRLDKSVPTFFLSQASFDETRRSRS